MEVIVCASILEKTYLEDKDQDQDKEMNKSKTEDTQNWEANIDHQNLHNEWRVAKVHPIKNVIRNIFKGVTIGTPLER